MASPKQIHYIECLMIDLGIDTSKGRRNLIGDIIGKSISADELSMSEASKVITELKRIKEGME